MNLYSDLSIFIPTYRRAGLVRTTNYLSEAALTVTLLVVRQSEYELYKQASPNAHLLVLPENVQNLSQTRNFILATCRTRYCMMLDDDLEFKYRPNINEWKLKNFPDKNMFDAMVTKMLDKMRAESLVHCAVSPVEGHSHYMAEWNYLQRYMRAYIFDLHVVGGRAIAAKRENWNFRYEDAVNGCEDFDMALQLISSGHPSVVCYAYAQTHESSNAKGGLSDYRTIEYHNNAMSKLRERWPKYVTLVERKTKRSWGGLPRIDVKVAWKKAYEDNAPLWYCRRGDNSHKPMLRAEPVEVK